MAGSKNLVNKNVSVTILARVGYMLSRLAIPPFIVAHLGLKQYGLWTSIFILVSYLGVSTMGISNVYVRYIAKYDAEADHRSANELLSTGLFITVPLCSGLFGLLMCCWPMLAGAMHLPAGSAFAVKEAVYLVVLVFLSSISLCAYSDLLSGVQRIDVVQIIWIIGYVLETVLIFALVGLGRGIRGMAEAYFVRTAISIVLSVILAYRFVPWLRISPRLLSKRALHSLVSFGAVVQVQCLLDVVLNSAERVIALLLGGFEMAGLLDLAKKMPASVSAVPLAFAGAFLPAASNLESSRREDLRSAMQAFYLEGARNMNLACAYFTGFLAVLAAPILSVWLNRSLPGAAYLLTLFAVSMQVHLLTGPGTSITKGIGRPQEEFHYCIPNLLLLAVLTPLTRLVWGQYSAVQVGTAVAISTILSATYFVHRINKQLAIPHLTYFRRVIFPGLLPYLAALPFGLVIGFNGINGISRLAGAGVLGVSGMLYSLVLVLLFYRFVLTGAQTEKIRRGLASLGGNRSSKASEAVIDGVLQSVE